MHKWKGGERGKGEKGKEQIWTTVKQRAGFVGSVDGSGNVNATNGEA